jgi:mannonate dehydratase
VTDGIRIGIGLPSDATDEQLQLAKQLGCEGVVLATPARLGDSGVWSYADLVALREWVESFGLRLEALQNLPHAFWHKARLGLPGRDAEIDNYRTTIRNIGRAGIPVLGYNFRPDPLYRTGTRPGRGGAEITAFDLDQAIGRPLTFGREISADEMRANHDYFLRAVLPVAEEAGVRLALHPDDPPGPALGGVARVCHTFDDFERIARIADSPAWGLLFCVGCWAEVGGTANVLRGIRHFGGRGQIAYVHFRDVRGTPEHFSEGFIGEGEVDITRVMQELRAVGFSGCLIDDHAPRMVGDTGWNPRSRCYQTGYLMGMLRAIRDLS